MRRSDMGMTEDYVRRSKQPLFNVSKIILLTISLNVVIHFVLVMLPAQMAIALLGSMALSPAVFSDEGGVNIIPFIVHGFLHGGWGHLGMNMVWFLIFGQALAVRFGADDRMKGASLVNGWVVFLSYYLSAIVFSGIIFLLLNLNQPVLLVGASGGISALMAGAIRVTFRRFQPEGLAKGRMLPVLDSRVMTMMLFYIGSNLILLTPLGPLLGLGSSEQIAWEAHVAGFAYGLVMMPFFDRLAVRR